MGFPERSHEFPQATRPLRNAPLKNGKIQFDLKALIFRPAYPDGKSQIDATTANNRIYRFII